MANTKVTRITLRKRTTSEWASRNEVLLDGEVGIITDVSPRQIKIGDGVTVWNDLPQQEQSVNPAFSNSLDFEI